MEKSESGPRLQIQFSCLKPAPQRYPLQVYEKAESRGLYPCLVCGDLVSISVGISCPDCFGKNRFVHPTCLGKIGVSRQTFKCSDIEEHLVPDELGHKTVKKCNPLSKIELPPRFYCLICGDTVREWRGEGRENMKF